MKVLIAFVTICMAAYVSADCYREVGCSDPIRSKKYRPGQRWKPKSDICYSCSCSLVTVKALECKVAIEEEETTAKPSLSQTETPFYGPLEPEDSTEIEEHVIISKEQAETMECPPTSGGVFNWETFVLELPKYKKVIYSYRREESSCCSRFPRITSVHPSCKVVKVGKCKERVVRRKYPRRSCNMAMSFIG